MAAEKVTPMVLKVDLQCPKCYKKIKKTLGKFPQIRDQVFNDKENTITVTVICCSPEKVRDRLYCKAGSVVKGIEIKKNAKPKEAGPQKPKEPEKPKDAAPQKPSEAAPVADKPEKPKEAAPAADKPEKPKEAAPAADKPEKPKEAAPAADKPEKPKAPPVESVPANGVPSVFPYVGPTYGGYDVPYYHGYGFPPPPPTPILYYEGYYGSGYNGYGPVNYGSVYGREGPVSRYDDGHFSEENLQSCSIM